jgi:hypothetical protein
MQARARPSMRLMTIPSSALVVLAVLLMHGGALGQKDETTHGPASMNSTGGRQARVLLNAPPYPCKDSPCTEY